MTPPLSTKVSVHERRQRYATADPPVLTLTRSNVIMAAAALAAAFAFIQWNVDHTLESLHARLAEHDARMQSLYASVDQVGGRVSSVDNTVAVAEVESVKVKDEVVEVKLKVDEIRSGLDGTSGKIDSLKTILHVAFQDDSDIRILLDDERLSELLPMDFFGDEPPRGAALPDAGAALPDAAGSSNDEPAGTGKIEPATSIAMHCLSGDVPAARCHRRLLRRYESRQGR